MIYQSPYPPIPLTGESITERVFRGLRATLTGWC